MFNKLGLALKKMTGGVKEEDFFEHGYLTPM